VLFAPFCGHIKIKKIEYHKYSKGSGHQQSGGNLSDTAGFCAAEGLYDQYCRNHLDG
jgi:hypothetical protein